MGLDQLEPLVHQGRRIDGNLRAHRPFGMRERLGARRPGDAFGAPLPKRTAGGGDRHADDFGDIAPAERLKDRIVLGIEGEQMRAMPGRRLHDDRSGADQRFLVRQRDDPAFLDRREGRGQSDRADDCGDDEVRGTAGGRDQSLDAGGDFDVVAGEPRLQIGITSGVGDGRELRAEGDRGARERGAVAAARDGLDDEPPGVSARTCAQERPIDPVAPSKTRRRGAFVAVPKCFIGSVAVTRSPFETSRAQSRTPKIGAGQDRGERGRGDKRVEPIHQSAVARNKVAGILDAGAPFHRGFEEIAELGNSGDDEAEPRARGPANAGGRRSDRDQRTQGRAERQARRSRPTRSCPAKRLATISGRRSSARRNRPRHPCPRPPQIATGWPAVHRPGSRAAGARPTTQRAGVEDPRPRPDPLARGRRAAPVTTAPAHKTATASAAAPFSAKGAAATSASAPTRDARALPLAADQALPFPQDADRGEQPERQKRKAADPRDAERRRAMSDTPTAARERQIGADPARGRARRGRFAAPQFAAPSSAVSGGGLTTRARRRSAVTALARRKLIERALETPPCRNRASGSAETRIRHRRPARAGNSTAAARRTCG